MKGWIYLFVFLFLVSFGYAENNGCCLLTTAGDSCVYTTESNCAEDFVNGALCENTDACRTGCCISEEGCFEETADYTCSLNSGEFFDDQICSAFETCQMTCCKVGSDYSFMNSGECQALIDEYGSDVVGSYSASDEAACEELEDQEQTGCCVTTSGCSMGTQAECGSSSYNSEGFGFFENEYCDSVSSYLAEKDYVAKDYCACEVSSEPVCDSDGLNIVEVDSCENYGEVVEACNFPDEICIENNGVAECSLGSCYFELSDKLVPYNPLWQNNFRNLESRCLYEGPAGNYQDLPGSRHYVTRCLAGEVVLEPCDDYREQVCVDNYVDDFDWAECVSNTVDSEEELVATVPIGKDWDDSSLIDTCGLDDVAVGAGRVNCYAVYGVGVIDQFWECDANCFCQRKPWAMLMAEYCKSRGDCGNDRNLLNQFTEGNFEMHKSQYSFGGNELRSETLVGCGDGCVDESNSADNARGLQCYPTGGECNFYDWQRIKSSYKNSLESRITGEVGLFTLFNYVGFNVGFFKDALRTGSDDDIYSEESFTEILLEFMSEEDYQYYFGVPIYDVSDFEGSSTKCKDDTGYDNSYVTRNLFYFTSGDDWISNLEKLKKDCDDLNEMDLNTEYIYGPKFQLDSIGYTADEHYGQAPEYDNKKRKVSVDIFSECGVWEPPNDGDDCSLCDVGISDGGIAIEDENGNVFVNYECSAYRCKSLGTMCQHIPENSGTDRPSCISGETDSTPPVISLWVEKMEELGYDYTEENDGTIVVDAPIGRNFFPILTDDFSKCKISDDPNIGLDPREDGFYDSLNYLYEDPLMGFGQEHNFTDVNLDGSKEYNYYIWCQNFGGLTTPVFYQFKLTTTSAPDTDAPEIEGIYPNSGEYVKADSESIILEVYLNENAYCKYSSQDLPYEQMTSEFASCAESDGFFNYVCSDTIALNVGTTNLYILCSDISGNIMPSSEYWTVAQSSPLEITQTSPSETLYTNEIVLQVNTKYGADNGNAICYAEGSGFPYQKLFFSGGTYHEQSLSLEKGSYSYAITCEDELENTATGSIDFIVDKDVSAAEITGVYYLGTNIYVLTNEATTCQYKTESFSYGNGYDMGGVASEAHSFSVSDFTSDYYVNCIDAYSNVLEGVKINLQYLIA